MKGLGKRSWGVSGRCNKNVRRLRVMCTKIPGLIEIDTASQRVVGQRHRKEMLELAQFA